MSEVIERVARAIARHKLSTEQLFYGGQTGKLRVPHTEDTLWPYFKDQAEAAVEEITKNAMACNVCGCAVYPGLPTSVSK